MGFLKTNYLRFCKESKDILTINNHPYGKTVYFLHIIFLLFCTPIYIGFLSTLLGFITHPKKKEINYYDDLYFGFSRHIFIFSIIKGLFFCPYIVILCYYIITRNFFLGILYENFDILFYNIRFFGN